MSERFMAWLQVASRLVLVQVMAVGLTLLGLVVLGAAPAAAAAARVAGPIRRDESLPVARTMWRAWRACLWRANLAAAPSAVLVIAAGGNLLLLAIGGFEVPATLGALLAPLAMLVLLASALIWLVSAVLVGTQEGAPGQTLRAAVLFPVAFPGTAVSLLITVAGVGLIGLLAPVLLVLCGASLTMMLTELIVSTRRQVLQAHLVSA